MPGNSKRFVVVKDGPGRLMSGMIHDWLDKKFWFEFHSKMSNGMVSSTLLLWISFMLKFEMADLSMFSLV